MHLTTRTSSEATTWGRADMTTIAAPRPAQAFPDAKPFPVAEAVEGHNRPPIEDQGVADFNDAIDRHAGLRQRINDLKGSASRATATDEESAGRCAELIRQISAAERVVDDERTTVKAPYLNAGRKIDEAAKLLVTDLGQAKASVRTITEQFMREEEAKRAAERRRLEDEQRREREAAEARAAEEAAAAAAENRAPDPEIMEAPIAVTARSVEQTPTQVRSDFGAVASARRVKVAHITDWAKAFKAVKSVPAVQDAIQKAINRLMNAGQSEIPGVEIKEDIGLSVR